MSSSGRSPILGSSLCLIIVILLLLQLVQPVAAFGAGNIASISRIEGKNWRHGDIEDTLKTLAFIKGHKWTSMMVKRVYFGNWLRDYSQAVDVGTLKGVQADTIRVLLWVLSFLTFGYATAEFEVTAERLGCYRPEEHIDNPKDYADNEDARKYDPRLRPPVQQIELGIDPETGLKNYISNEKLGIATSAGYVKHSLNRSIHFGRMYRHGAGGKRGREEDLCEALRCLGQALHCCEDYGAHSNYCELALRELGYRNVFPHCGVQSEINLRGHRVFPIVTGTFGGVDFLHSVIGEANDHFTQSEVDELDKALSTAQTSGQSSSRGFDNGGEEDSAGILVGLLSQIPGTGDLGDQARQLQAASQEQERLNASQGLSGPGDAGGYGGYGSSRGFESERDFGGSERADASGSGSSGPSGLPGGVPNVDPQEVIKKVYPILAFRDRVVKTLSATIEKIPGLEALVEKITETVTLFVLRLMAPFIRPVIEVASKQLKSGSSAIVDSSGKHQYEPWTDPHCTDPTHSLLSKDHFTNVLNEVAGQVASQILKYVVPRVLWAWEHPDAGLDQIMADIVRVFHHPAIRDNNCEVHRSMFETVERWARQSPHNLDQILSSESVRAGKNQIGTEDPTHQGSGAMNAVQGILGGGNTNAATGNLAQNNSAWQFVQKLGITGGSTGGGGGGGLGGALSSIGNLGGMKIPGISREMDFEQEAGAFGRAFPGTETEFDNSRPPPGPESDFASRASPYPAGAFGYQTGPQYEGGYEDGYHGHSGPPPSQYGEFGGYGGSGGPPPMGDPMGGPPPGQYGGPPPPGQYGGYPPNMPPQGQTYGGPPGGGGYYERY